MNLHVKFDGHKAVHGLGENYTDLFRPKVLMPISLAIILIVSASAFYVATAKKLSSETKELQRVLTEVLDSPINCSIKEAALSDTALLACKFPLDISLYHLGFYVQTDGVQEQEKEVVTSCYVEQTSVQCLGKDGVHTEGHYDVIVFHATIPVTLSVARLHKLSCQLLTDDLKPLQSRFCELPEKANTQTENCVPINVHLVVSLIISLFFNAAFVVRLLKRSHFILKILGRKGPQDGNVDCSTCNNMAVKKPDPQQPHVEEAENMGLLQHSDHEEAGPQPEEHLDDSLLKCTGYAEYIPGFDSAASSTMFLRNRQRDIVNSQTGQSNY